MDHGQEKNWGDWREMVVSWTSCGDERWIGRAFFFFFFVGGANQFTDEKNQG